MPCSLLPELESGLLSSWKTTKPKDGSYPVDTAPRSPCSIGQAVSQPSWQPVCSEHETFWLPAVSDRSGVPFTWYFSPNSCWILFSHFIEAVF